MSVKIESTAGILVSVQFSQPAELSELFARMDAENVKAIHDFGARNLGWTGLLSRTDAHLVMDMSEMIGEGR